MKVETCSVDKKGNAAVFAVSAPPAPTPTPNWRAEASFVPEQPMSTQSACDALEIGKLPVCLTG